MLKLTDKLRLMKWKPVIKSLDEGMNGIIWASENLATLKKYPEIENEIDNANRIITSTFELIEKQISKENPDMDKEYIKKLTENEKSDEENPEWIKLENELIDILSEKFERSDATEMVETLDMEWLLDSFEDETKMKILERDYLR